MFDPLDFDSMDFEMEGSPPVSAVWWDTVIEERHPRDDDEVLVLF